MKSYSSYSRFSPFRRYSTVAGSGSFLCAVFDLLILIRKEELGFLPIVEDLIRFVQKNWCSHEESRRNDFERFHSAMKILHDSYNRVSVQNILFRYRYGFVSTLLAQTEICFNLYKDFQRERSTQQRVANELFATLFSVKFWRAKYAEREHNYTTC